MTQKKETYEATFTELAIENLAKILLDESVGETSEWTKQSHFKSDIRKLSASTLLAIYNVALKYKQRSV